MEINQDYLRTGTASLLRVTWALAQISCSFCTRQKQMFSCLAATATIWTSGGEYSVNESCKGSHVNLLNLSYRTATSVIFLIMMAIYHFCSLWKSVSATAIAIIQGCPKKPHKVNDTIILQPWPNCDHCISHGSVATTLERGGQN